MCGHIRRDKIRNEVIQNKVGVAFVGQNEESKVETVWAYKRRCTHAPLRRYERLAIAGFTRGKGGPKKNYGR